MSTSTQPRPPLRRRLRYAFDNTMSRGPIALIGWLAALSLVIVVLAGLLIFAFNIGPQGEEPLDFVEGAWASLMRTLDAGTMGGDAGWGWRVVALLVTIGGIFVVASLIGVITSALEAKLDELRKGKSEVLETGHTLILGWSPKIFTILSELAIANANVRRPRIVILADQDKVEMEDEIRVNVPDLGKTKVICRSGDPLSVQDLKIASPDGAKSIIVLGPPEDNDDSHVIKALLALLNNPERSGTPYHVVAEMQDGRNRELVESIGGEEVQVIVSNDLIARITAQTCRQSGLSVVYTELLDYEGDEIYFQHEPALTGHTFGEALLSYEESAVVGLKRDNDVVLNPPMDTVLADGYMIVAVTADDDTVRLLPQWPAQPDTAAIVATPAAVSAPERTLVLGWNHLGVQLIGELDNYVAPGSEVTVVANLVGIERILDELEGRLTNETLTFVRGDTTRRDTLESLDTHTYDHIIIMSYRDILAPQEADTRTLLTLLYLRSIAEREEQDFSIVTEMLDTRNRELARVTQADDFIVSDELISLLLSQVSENPDLNAVFTDLFDAGGSEISLKPVTDYVQPGAEVDFYTVVEAARRRNEVAFGYRVMAHAADPDRQYGVVINPKKSDRISFAPGDTIVVIAED